MVGLSEDTTTDTTTDDQLDHSPRILFPIDGESTTDFLPLVCDIVADIGAELYLASPVTVPNQTPLDTPQLQSQGKREAAKYALRAKQDCTDPGWIETIVGIGHHRDNIIEDLVDKYQISTVITEHDAQTGIESHLGFDGIDSDAIDGVCDTIFVSRFEPIEEIDSVIVPIARGPHSGLAIEVGLAIARQHDAVLELFHVYEPDGDQNRVAGQEVLDHGLDRITDYDDVNQTLRGSPDVEATIIEHIDPYDVTVFGAPREGLLRQYITGSIPKEVSARADGIVLTTHKGGAEKSWLDRWL